MTEVAKDSRLRDMNRGMVAIYKQKIGKGPVKATTEITDTMVVSLISGSLTIAEEGLVDQGKQVLVREMRRNFQETMRGDIEALVEEVLGRRCKSFLSDHDVVTDVAAEVVIFEA